MSPSLGGNRSSRAGFTLLELIVVLGVLTVLYSVAAFGFHGGRRPLPGPGEAVERLRRTAIRERVALTRAVPVGLADSVLVRALPDGRLIGWPPSAVRSAP